MHGATIKIMCTYMFVQGCW